MQIYDFLYHVFQYIFLLSIPLCCYHTFLQYVVTSDDDADEPIFATTTQLIG